jgi:hypothetical protein
LRIGVAANGRLHIKGLSIRQSDLNIPLSVLIHGFGTGTGEHRSLMLLAQLYVKGCIPEKTNNARTIRFLIFL